MSGFTNKKTEVGGGDYGSIGCLTMLAWLVGWSMSEFEFKSIV